MSVPSKIQEVVDQMVREGRVSPNEAHDMYVKLLEASLSKPNPAPPSSSSGDEYTDANVAFFEHMGH